MILALGLNDVPGVMNNALRTLCAWLCEFLYPLIADLYQLFMNMGKIAYYDDFSTIYNKISLIIGVFMVFRVTFWLIEIMVSPDKISDKEKNPTKIIQKVLIAVVMLAITPTIFEYAFKIQNIIIDENIIGNIMSVSDDGDPSEAGRYLSAEIFSNFYNDNLAKDECTILVDKDQLGSVYSQLYDFGELSIVNKCLTAKYNNDEEYQIDFNGIFAVAVGAFVFWMLLMYCISIGTRYIQLIYLQVIAPVPIMCYLTPNKDSMFSKWLKQCTTTYLDLFIRIAIVNLVMILSNVILNDSNGVFAMFDNGWIISIFMILGLLTFAKKAPDLIQELLPKSVTKASGDFGLSWKKRTDSMLGGKYVSTLGRAATVGVASAGLTGAVGFLGGRGTGRITGMFGGLTRGLVAGSKSGSPIKTIGGSIKKQTDVNKRKIDWANNGSTFGGRMSQRLANVTGMEGRAESYDNQISKIDIDIEKHKDSIAQLKRKSVAYKEISDGKSNMENRAESKLLNEAYDSTKHPVRYKLQEQVLKSKATLEHLQQTGASADDIAKAQMQYNITLKQAKQDYISAVIQGSVDDKAMKSMLQHMNNVVMNDKARGDNSFDGLNANFVNYDDLDKFEGQATTRRNDVTEGYTDSSGNKVIGINEVEGEIRALEDKKAEIKAKDEYKAADADRNAVGGHRGGKK